MKKGVKFKVVFYKNIQLSSQIANKSSNNKSFTKK